MTDTQNSAPTLSKIDGHLDVSTLLKIVIDNKASDLHLISGAQPTLRIHGELQAIPNTSILSDQDLRALVPTLMSSEQFKIFSANKDFDFAINFSPYRFRVNTYVQKGQMAAALRLIDVNLKSMADLGLPDVLYKLSKLRSGLVLVVGPTGHGKSTTVSSMIEEINATRAANIITIEDPVEYIYTNKKSIFSQREVGADTNSFQSALKSILREDPDVVVVGEMRDYETIAAALTIAETGHLVFGTLHTNSAAQTIDRIVDVFPAHQQQQIRFQLSSVIEGVISQRLVPALSGGRVPALEILLGTTALRTNIREGKSHMIDNVIQTSQEAGMISLESYLANLVSENKITIDVAKTWSLKPDELMRRLEK